MVIRMGWVVGTALALAAACGGGQVAPSAPAPAAARSSAPAVAKKPAPSDTTPVAPPPPPSAAGPVAFTCDEEGAASVPPRTDRPPPAVPAVEPRAVAWRRLTPPVSIGAPPVQLLHALPKTLVAAGYGIKVSLDDGKTFVDASTTVLRSEWGDTEGIIGLVAAGEEMLAASEHGAYRSTARGTRWLRCSNPPRPADPSRTLSERRRVAYGGGVAFVSVGERLFTSTDVGKTFVAAPTKMPLFMPDGLVATERALYLWSGGNFAILYRSKDRGATWERLYESLGLKPDEGFTTVTAAGGKLYASTVLGALLESSDGGNTWKRRWLGKGPDYQAPRAHGVWSTGADLLVDSGLALLRLGKAGKPESVLERRNLAVAVRGSDVFALGNDYLARSTDGGRTFRDERVQGLADDIVQRVSVSGKTIGIIASGPTAFFSTDGGATFQRGPEISGAVRVAAVADGIYFTTSRAERAALLFQPAAGGPTRQLAMGLELGNTAPDIVAAEGKTLVLYPWSLGTYLVSRDGGMTFTELPKLDFRHTDRGAGLVRGDQVIVAPGGYLHRARPGEPFENLQRTFGPKRKVPHARSLFVDGGQVYIVNAEDVLAWNTTTDAMTSLAGKVPRNAEQKEWIDLAAVHGDTVLVQVRGSRRYALYLSRDRGRSYHEIDGPESWAPAVLVASEDGILVAGKGLWLLPVQRR